jgi:hypothetical protein
MMLMLIQAAVAAPLPIPTVPVTDPSIKNLIDAVSDQTGLVFVSVWLIQYMKRSQWPIFAFINANSGQVTKWASFATALVAALAIQIHIQGSAALGWNGTFVIPNVHALWTGFVRFCGAKMGQDILYNTVYNKPVEVIPVAAPRMNAAGKPTASSSAAPMDTMNDAYSR